MTNTFVACRWHMTCIEPMNMAREKCKKCISYDHLRSVLNIPFINKCKKKMIWFP